LVNFWFDNFTQVHLGYMLSFVFGCRPRGGIYDSFVVAS